MFVCVQLEIQLKFMYIYLANFYIDFLHFFTRKTFNGILSFLKYKNNYLQTILWYTIIYIFSEVSLKKLKIIADCSYFRTRLYRRCLFPMFRDCRIYWDRIYPVCEYIIDILGLRILLDRTSGNRLIGISIIVCFMVSTSIERHPSL